MEYRALAGPRLVAALSTESPLRKLAMKLGMGTAVDEAGDPVDLESTASVLAGSLPTWRGARTNASEGGIGRAALPRRPGQTMSQRMEIEEDVDDELWKGDQAIDQSEREILPRQVHGVLLAKRWAKRWAYGY